jgi:plasmid maintenance system antidote protein VapI
MHSRLKARIIEEYGSQSNFAQALREQESFVSEIIHGRKRLSFEKQSRWTKALGRSVSGLLKGEQIKGLGS